jgi:hypothetical protein
MIAARITVIAGIAIFSLAVAVGLSIGFAVERTLNKRKAGRS